MKKLLVIILTLLMVCMCGCKNAVKDTNSNISSENGKIIKVNLDKAKMLFYAKNGDIVQGLEKEYIRDDNARAEEFKKENVAPKSFSILNTEYNNFTYTGSVENKYSGDITDTFENGGIKADFNQNGSLKSVYFSTKGIKIFEDATSASKELAKRYLEELMPSYKYDYIDAQSTTVGDITVSRYYFYKKINGIRTSESVSIWIASTGNLVSFSKFDIGRYDGIKIVGADMDAFAKKIESCMKEVYKDYFVGCEIGDEGPRYEISKDNKLRISFPVEVTVKIGGAEYKTGEKVAFDLN